jgi:hypothetical protein
VTEPINEPEPVDPGEDPGVDPPADDDTSDEDGIDQAEVIDVPEWQEAPDYSLIESDVR